ncbi:unnamed protein product [Medioppia subpectinata]|uniref:Prefoldin subunit 1 n=1 Tax=Medioppia subpectinata TaxID=1979941 RepID=A0A7R9PV02_9ACAR|nr:unnamed protein product [Medioppia subpectinata]CAG2102134.1 unnamed protein product [Medioppia subpectinata]
MSSTVDLELKKAFQELQVQVIETRGRVRQMDQQMDTLKRSCQHSRITLGQLKEMPEQTPLYESIGRMFVRRDKQSIHQLLEDKIATNEDKCKQLSQSKTYNESKVKESENNLRELINSKKLHQ